MSRQPSSRQTATIYALVRPRPSDLNQLASAKPVALQPIGFVTPKRQEQEGPGSKRRGFTLVIVLSNWRPSIRPRDVARAREST